MSTLTELEAIRAQLAELTEQVRQLAAWKMYADTFWTVGYQEGETAARRALLGHAAETSKATSRRAASRLRIVGDDTAS